MDQVNTELTKERLQPYHLKYIIGWAFVLWLYADEAIVHSFLEFQQMGLGPR